MNYLVTIIGPTAIGKTSLSISLSQHFGCDIVSCDSRQFFNEMQIGTAVPSKEELVLATHHFIQNKSIFENYSVGDFEKDAIATLDKLFLKNNIQIMVGGSGLYVDAILKGFDDFPDIDSGIRNNIKNDYQIFGLDYLQNSLKQFDANYYQYLERNNPQTLLNPQRMTRFVEVCMGTGKPYSSFLKQDKTRRNFTPIIIGLEADRTTIYERINLRVDKMIHDGLVAEVEALLPYKHLNALKTVGYNELFEYFEGKISLDCAVEEIKKNTRRFSKRQLTWFKRTENVRWFDFKNEKSEIVNYINSLILNPNS